MTSYTNVWHWRYDRVKNWVEQRIKAREEYMGRTNNYDGQIVALKELQHAVARIEGLAPEEQSDEAEQA